MQQYIKENEDCGNKIVESYKKGCDEGYKIGKRKTQVQVIKNMMDDNVSAHYVQTFLPELTEHEIEEIYKAEKIKNEELMKFSRTAVWKLLKNGVAVEVLKDVFPLKEQEITDIL